MNENSILISNFISFFILYLGWDYSSRWMDGNRNEDRDELLYIVTGDIIPVDLNSFLCRNAEIIAAMFRKVEKHDRAEYYDNVRDKLKAAIKAVLFDEADQVWYDYNIVKQGPHNKQWYPSNIAPLYTGCHHEELNTNATVQYIIRNTVNYTGGVPTSLERTKQQWDLPNTWPPLVEMVVTALENVSWVICHIHINELPIFRATQLKAEPMPGTCQRGL